MLLKSLFLQLYQVDLTLNVLVTLLPYLRLLKLFFRMKVLVVSLLKHLMRASIVPYNLLDLICFYLSDCPSLLETSQNFLVGVRD